MPRAKKSETAAESLDFEASLKELEGVVLAMEAGEMSLEDSLKAFERGMKLSKDCQSALAAAELKIQTLTEQLAEADSAE